MPQCYTEPQHLMDVDEPTKKRVRFREVLAHTALVEPLTNKANWYSSADFNQFRASATDLCETAYSEACSKALELFSAPRCDQHILNFWCLHGEPIRGFESIVNPHLGQKRKRDRGRHIHSVLIAQSLSRQQKAAGNELDAIKFIATMAIKESADARKFAYMMGKADENAVKPHTPFVRRCSKVVASSA